MSYLLPVPLLGVGTAHVESLSSYLYRLAAAHGVSVLRLINHAMLWFARTYPDRVLALESLWATSDLSILVRPNETTQRVVELLEAATGQRNLRCGTFLSLKKALDRSKGMFSPRVRWCAECLSEQERGGNEVYHQLMWALVELTHCPIHRTPLENKCPNCGSYQSVLGRRPTLEYCCACGKKIIVLRNHSDPINSWEVQAKDVIDVVDLIAHDQQLEFPENAIRNALTDIFEKVWATETESQLWKLIPRDTFLGLMTGVEPVTLTTARRLSYRLGLRLVDLLEGTVRSTTNVLNPEWTRDLPESMKPRRRLKKNWHEAILKRLNEDPRVTNKSSPPSLKEIACIVGVSVGYLQYHYPIQSKQFVNRFREYSKLRRHRQALEARVLVLEYLTSEIHQDQNKSKKWLLKTLRARTGLPKNLLRKEITFAMSALSPAVQQSAAPRHRRRDAEEL